MKILNNTLYFNKITLSSLAILALSGCARNINPNVYSEKHVGEASMTYQGVIVSARAVEITGGEKLEENAAGIGLGAIAGGVLGNQIGQGGGNVAATAGGAILGGVAGAFAQQALTAQNAMEYIVQLTNGSMMTVVQGPEVQLSPGQRVLVMVSHDGRSRVVPDQSPVQSVQPLAPAPMVIKRR
jgi:outer membrane lipoprotein SlyB